MKILILADSMYPFSSGGAEKVAFNCAKGYSELGNDVTIVTTVEKGVGFKLNNNSINEILFKNMKRSKHWCHYTCLDNPVLRANFFKEVNLADFSIVHAHNVYHQFGYKILNEISNLVPVVKTHHDAMAVEFGKLTPSYQNGTINFRHSSLQAFKKQKFRYNPLRNYITKKYLNKIYNVSVSNILSDALKSNGIKIDKVIYNGILVDQKIPKDFETTINDTFKPSQKILTFAGRLSIKKGAQFLLELAEFLKKEEINFKIMIYCAKTSWERFRIMLKETMHQSFVYGGWVNEENLYAAFRKSDLVLVPSMYLDPFGMVILESMINKTPALVSKWSGGAEIIEDGVNGFLFDPKDYQLIFEKIRNALQSKNRLSQMGKNGFEVAKSFTHIKMAKEYLNFFESIANF